MQPFPLGVEARELFSALIYMWHKLLFEAKEHPPSLDFIFQSSRCFVIVIKTITRHKMSEKQESNVFSIDFYNWCGEIGCSQECTAVVTVSDTFAFVFAWMRTAK